MRQVFQIYRFHQLLNNSGTWFPIQWDCIHEKWIHRFNSKGKSTIKSYFIFSITLKLFMVTLGIIIIQTALLIHNLFELYHILAQAVMVFLILFTVVVDCLILKHIEILSLSSNWAHKIFKYRRIPRKDELFICKLVLAPNLSVMVLIYTCVIMYVFLDMDPFYNILKCFKYFTRIGFSLKYYQYVVLKQIRLIVCFGVAHQILAGCLNLILVGNAEGLYRCVILKILGKQIQPSKFLVMFYRQCFIASNAIKSFEYELSTFILSGVFMICIVFSNIFHIGFHMHMSIPVIVSIGIIFFIIVVLDIIFVIGCSFYTLSLKVLVQWRNSTGRRNAYLHRVVKSLQIIAYPAGDAGIIDTEIKVNYFYSLLVNTTNSIITVQSLM